MGEDITDIHVEEFKKSPVPIVLAASFDKQNETSSVNMIIHSGLRCNEAFC